MDWLDKAHAEARAITERLRLIVEHEEEIYEALWGELKTHVDAAREEFPDLKTNGQQLARVVKLSMKTGTKELKIELSKSDHTIRALEFPYFLFTLDVDVCDDGVVCLQLNGEQISLKDAAVAILRPFLFPQLYPNHYEIVSKRPKPL